MRLAMPLMEDKGRQSAIHPHFGHVSSIAVYDTGTKKLEILPVEKTDGCSPIAALEGNDVDAIYTFGMGMRAIELCEQKGIKLKTGNFRTVEDVIKNVDKLGDLEGSCGH